MSHGIRDCAVCGQRFTVDTAARVIPRVCSHACAIEAHNRPLSVSDIRAARVKLEANSLAPDAHGRIDISATVERPAPKRAARREKLNAIFGEALFEPAPEVEGPSRITAALEETRARVEAMLAHGRRLLSGGT